MATRRWRQRNAERLLAYNRSIYDSDRRKARTAVMTAIRSGQLVRQSCADCGSENSQAHHAAGYAPEHWLTVEWLCAVHHATRHPRKENT